MSIFNGIKSNDVVKVKFKELKEMYTDLDSLYTLMDDGFQYNMRAVLNGGQFIVLDGPQLNNFNKKEYIRIENHLDNATLDLYEEFIDKLEIVTDIPTFKNSEMGLLITRLDNQLIINGTPLKYVPEDMKKMPILNVAKHATGPTPNGGLKEFREFMESWIMDMATEEVMGENDK